MKAEKIIITGSATRIGAAIAKSLAGYDVQITLHYNKSGKEIKKLKRELENYGSKVFLIKADLSIVSQTKRIIPFAYKMMNGLDCLINNASIFEKDDLINFNEKSFNKHMNVNLQAPATLSQNFKKCLKSKKGNIINIIDQRIFKLTPFFFSYTLSKAGLQTLTKTSAMKLAPNIRVNGVAPGPTIKNKRQSDKHFKKQWRSLILKEKVDPKNICETIKYFINNDNITGQIISVDGGQSLAWQTPDIINTKE
jgi:NAD(P)-dependent dehydrogenase (short-subunit alcohol dehydrogenase family)